MVMPRCDHRSTVSLDYLTCPQTDPMLADSPVGTLGPIHWEQVKYRGLLDGDATMRPSVDSQPRISDLSPDRSYVGGFAGWNIGTLEPEEYGDWGSYSGFSLSRWGTSDR